MWRRRASVNEILVFVNDGKVELRNAVPVSFPVFLCGRDTERFDANSLSTSLFRFLVISVTVLSLPFRVK